MLSNAVWQVEWKSYSDFSSGIAHGGINHLYCTGGLGSSNWPYATRDAIYMNSNTINMYEWSSYGYIWHGVATGGILCFAGYTVLVGSYWYIATIAT